MKKKILGGIAAIAIAAFAVVNVNVNSQSDNLLSDLALANVEALASGESRGPTPCGGEKINGVCQCFNTVNCKDLYGCQ